MFGMGMFGLGNMSATFRSSYRCYSVSMMPGQERPDVAKGGKIIMPPSALDQLTRLNIQYPMLFKLTNKRISRSTHAGVLEFVAEEGRVYFPYWMMKNLVLEEGDIVEIENVSLPVAKFAKFQPQSVDFLDITNQKAVLENALRSFACLSTGDMVEIQYNNKAYELCVLETKPGKAVSIIECDMDVDFAPPVGYQEPARVPRTTSVDDDHHVRAMDVADTPSTTFKPFAGTGNRVDGKKKPVEQAPPPLKSHEVKRGIPNYDYVKGTITFVRNYRFNETSKVEEDNRFLPFSGQGQVLRTKRK